MIDTFIKFELIEDPGDHELARMLRDRGWNNRWRAIGNANEYLNEADETIAIVFYDNQNLTKRVFLRTT